VTLLHCSPTLDVVLKMFPSLSPIEYPISPTANIGSPSVQRYAGSHLSI
jgi:hypothetical protein